MVHFEPPTLGMNVQVFTQIFNATRIGRSIGKWLFRPTARPSFGRETDEANFAGPMTLGLLNKTAGAFALRPSLVGQNRRSERRFVVAGFSKGVIRRARILVACAAA